MQKPLFVCPAALVALSSLAVVVGAACATTHEANWQAQPVAKAATDEEKAAGGSLVAEGDALWAERGDKQKLIAAIAKWEEAAAKAPDAALATKLGRAHYLLGDGYLVIEGDLAGRDAEYQKGLDWATTALKLSAPEFAAAMAAGKKHAEAIGLAPKESIEAAYWYASNLGKWANAKGFATRLKYKDDIKATMEHVKALDETFFYAAPYRYFGAFEAATSGLAGGDLKKSEENFKKAVMMAPAYLGTKVLWADYLCTKTQDRATYERLLKEVIAADANADAAIAPENKIEQEKAKQLLAKIDEVF